MSDPSHDPIRTRPRNGCVIALVVIVGAIMLLPGMCAIFLVGLDPKETLRDPNWGLLMFTLVVIGAAGGALIWWAIRQGRRHGLS
jgi:NADH:ubiquinone oxidoreductase subunit 6 (subunit J)